MTPKEYLLEQFNSVSSALGETLRQDYGPDLSSEYYRECANRLLSIEAAISGIKPSDSQSISAYLSQLNDVSNWICLIERSQLGAFSWPFAFALRRMSVALLSEMDLKGDLQKPIVHIVADGTGYLINYESRVRHANASQKFVVISFPRALKHHVLLHTIFGHELGHAALYNTTSGSALISGVINPLISSAASADSSTMTAWLHDAAAPSEIKRQLVNYKAQTGSDFAFNSDQHYSWVIELFCDLFGLVLFGPSFLAAHQSILRSMDANPYEFNLFSATHPPYAVRQRLMADAMKVLGWDVPIIPSSKQHLLDAERRFLNYLTNDPYSPWANIVNTANIGAAASCLQGIFSAHKDLSYSSPDPFDLAYLVERLIKRLPPVHESMSSSGEPSYKATHITHSTYAGWIYWLSRDNISVEQPLSFSLTNRLCDQGLLQQEAINRVFYPELVT